MYSKPYAKGHHIKHLQEKKASGDQTQTTLSDLPVPMTVTSNSDHDRSLEMVYSSMGEKSGGGLGGRMAAQTASLGDQDIMTYMPSNSTNGISSPLHPESGAVGAPVGGACAPPTDDELRFSADLDELFGADSSDGLGFSVAEQFQEHHTTVETGFRCRGVRVGGGMMTKPEREEARTQPPDRGSGQRPDPSPPETKTPLGAVRALRPQRGQAGQIVINDTSRASGGGGTVTAAPPSAPAAAAEDSIPWAAIAAAANAAAINGEPQQATISASVPQGVSQSHTTAQTGALDGLATARMVALEQPEAKDQRAEADTYGTAFSSMSTSLTPPAVRLQAVPRHPAFSPAPFSRPGGFAPVPTVPVPPLLSASSGDSVIDWSGGAMTTVSAKTPCPNYGGVAGTKRSLSPLVVSEDTNDRHKRQRERNLREQQRSHRITDQIGQLREVLEGANIPTKPDKYSTLVSVVNYIKDLQSQSTKLDTEHTKLLDTLSKTNEAANSHKHHSTSDSSSTTVDASSSETRPSSTPMDDELKLFLRSLNYKSVLFKCGVALGIASVDGRFIDCNDDFVELSGHCREELVGPPGSDSSNGPLPGGKKRMSLFNILARGDMEKVFGAMSRMLKNPVNGIPHNQVPAGAGIRKETVQQKSDGPVGGGGIVAQVQIQKFHLNRGDHWSGVVRQSRRMDLPVSDLCLPGM